MKKRKQTQRLSWLGAVVMLFSLLLPSLASAAPSTDLPPNDMFQLPWEQGLAWYVLDGLDNGTKRGVLSNHNYLNGGAVDFAPRLDIKPGDDTSNYWVTAAAAGTIIEMGSCHLKIDHGNGWITEYQFLADFQVGLGDEVYRNQKLGTIADGVRTPFCPPALYPDIPHVHFSLRPTTWNALFAGWQVTYDPITNLTVLVRGTETGTPYIPPPVLNGPALQIVDRGVIEENILYQGSLDAYRYERWTLQLPQAGLFTITTTALTDGLQPLIILLDGNGNELARGLGTLTTTQPAGEYFVQVIPQNGQGFYEIIWQGDGVSLLDPYILVRAPANLNLGENATVEAYLGNIPAEGYSSVEVTCPYEGGLLSVSQISGTNLFGSDPASAIFGPENSSFIFSVSGSHAQRAYQDGVVFTFNVTTLSPGETFLQCDARVSFGDGTLTEIVPIGSSITISETEIVLMRNSLPLSSTLLTGQVFANKAVTVSLYDENNSLVNTSGLDANNRFSFSPTPQMYTVLARAVGYLPAQGVVTVLAESVHEMPAVALLAGDIDGNFTIDQFDAMSIGMNYNTAFPDAADLNADGTINVLDLELLADNYRASGVQAWP